LDLAVDVAPRVVASRTQFLAEEDVCDVRCAQTLHQRLPVELRIAPAVGNGSDITHRLDAVPCQQTEEVLQRMRRMSDGENALAHGSNRPPPPQALRPDHLEKRVEFFKVHNSILPN
jgi:hypothetical protein